MKEREIALAVARKAEAIYQEIEGRKKLVENFRRDEALARSLGAFEAADFLRQLGDVYERTDEAEPSIVMCMAGERGRDMGLS